MSSSLASLGFIGTGVMGRSMVGHLLRAGYPVRVYNRTKSRAEALLKEGATWADSPAEVAHDADVVLTIVGYPSDVEAVYLGKDGILAAMKRGGMVVDLTTSSPSLAQRIQAMAAERGVAALDAPVTGGDIGAREARLCILVGGDKAAFERARPILERLGKTIVHMGTAGAGQQCKLCNQIMIAGTMIGMVEGMAYAKKVGLDPQTVIETLGAGAAGSWSLNNLAPRILKGDLEPGFMIEHFVKDMGLALEEGRKKGIKLTALELVHGLYASLEKKGLARKGTQALMKAVE